MAYTKRYILSFLILSLLLVFFSCKRKEGNNSGNYSDEFKVIYNNFNRLNDVKKPKQAIIYLDSAFKHVEHQSYNDKFRYYAIHFLYNKKTAQNKKLELLYADSMLNTAQKSPTQKQYVSNYAEANFAKGDAYFDSHQYNDAYRCFYEGYYLGRNYFDNAVLAEYTYRMGMIMFRQSHFNLAANYFKESYRQSLSYHDDFRSFYQRQELLDNIGESYLQNGDIDSAWLYFGKALNYINQDNSRFKSAANAFEVARAVVYGNQGKVLLIKGQYQQSEDTLKKSIDINIKKGNDNYNAELVEINLAQLYLERNDDVAFKKLMNNLHHQLDSVKNKETEVDWNRLMKDYYAKKGDFRNALLYSTNYCALKDSLVKQKSSFKETDVIQQQANYDKQYQIDILKDDNKQQLLYLYIAVICVTMAVIIIFLVVRNWKRSRYDVQAVNALNKQIGQQNTDLEVTYNELKLNSQEKDRILRTVAHDLRNPLGGIASLTGLMAEETEYTDEQRELINLIKETSNDSLELINEILEATDNTLTKLNKEKQLIEINSLLSHSVELLRFKAAEKDQQIILELIDTHVELLIGREKIWRVISNLISNAIKFSPEKSLITVKLANQQNKVVISVKDNGIGIADDMKDKVFNMFTEAKRPGTAGEKSFGLGLSICKQIIENHNGRIWFDSTTGKGTTFYFSLNKPKA